MHQQANGSLHGGDREREREFEAPRDIASDLMLENIRVVRQQLDQSLRHEYDGQSETVL